MSSRIVATGAGVISSIGAGTEEFAEALYAARSGIAPCGLLEPEGPAAAAAAIRDFAPERWLGAKGLRVLDRSARLLCVAAQMALSSSGLAGLTAEEDTDSRGLVCGTMFGGVHSIVAFDWSGLTEGPKYVNPMDFPNTVINSPAGQAAIRFKLRGINSTISSGLASGLYAIHYAAEFLRLGRASALLAGGVEELCQESLLGFIKNGLISPRGRIFPFSADGGDGTIPGEGSALWVLETEERARARGVKPLAEVCGFGAAHDARSINAYHPEADGATAAVLGALQASGIPPEAIGLIVASANGSRGGDAMELRALSRVFGSRLEQIPVCAPKAAFGEALGASGALLALTGGMALQRRLAPPTVVVGGAARRLRLLQHPEPLQGEYALVNCFGCDGNNASLVLRRWPE